MSQVTETLKNFQNATTKLESKDCYASKSDKSKYLNEISTKESEVYNNLENFFREMSKKKIPIVQLSENSKIYINNINSFYQNSISYLDIIDKACECNSESEEPILNQILPGKNFKDHYIGHRSILEKFLNKKYPKWKEDLGVEFLLDLKHIIDSKSVIYQGLYTVKKDTLPIYLYRGNGMSLMISKDYSFFTLIRSGEAMDLALRKYCE